MRYEINPTNFAVSVFDDINAEAFWFQPNYPNGDAFDSVEEATEWAELAVLSMDSEHGFFAPEGKGLEAKAKPTPLEIIESKLLAIGLTVDDLKTILG